MTEVWLPLLGYSGCYSASNLGKIRNDRTGRVLKPSLRRGYPIVSLSKDGSAATITVHRAVLIAFCGPEPFEGAQVAHNDGNRENCQLANLRWASPKENQADRVRHGTRVFGERVFGAKLNDQSVSRIRKRLQTGEVNRTIANDFGVSVCTIHLIRHNRIWRHVA